MRTFGCVVALTLGAGLSASSAQASLVAYWAFPSTVPASADNFKMAWPIPADAKANAGLATLDTDARKWDGTLTNPTALQQGALQFFTGSALNLQTGFVAGADLSMRSLNGDSNGKSYFFRFDNTGFIDLIMSFAERYTSTGPTNVDFAYSTDGTTYTTLPALSFTTTRDSTYRTRTVDLSAVDALDGLSSAYIKMTFTGFSTTNQTGSVRLDNILFDAVPSPGTAVLAFAGLSGMALRRRRSIR